MEIDARGFACPRPVIMTKRAISENSLEEVLVRVDNEVATENLKKMADQLGYTTSIVEIDNGFAVINKLNETSFLK